MRKSENFFGYQISKMREKYCILNGYQFNSSHSLLFQNILRIVALNIEAHTHTEYVNDFCSWHYYIILRIFRDIHIMIIFICSMCVFELINQYDYCKNFILFFTMFKLFSKFHQITFKLNKTVVEVGVLKLIDAQC